MALLAFSAVVLSCFLLACVVLLVLDLRGERRAVRAAIQALGRRVQDHDDQIGRLVRAAGVADGHEPVPAPARAALPAAPAPVSMSGAPVTLPASVPSRRPPHAPPVKVAPPASSTAPATVPRQSTERQVRPWERPFKPTAEQVEAARAAHAEVADVDGDERKTVEIPRAIVPAPPNVARALGARGTMLGLGVEAGDGETDESLTRVWSADETTPTAPSPGAPASSRRPMAEEYPDLSPETLERVDALARDRGVSREEMLRSLADLGIGTEERRRDGGDPGDEKS